MGRERGYIHTSKKLGCLDRKCGEDGLSSSESDNSDISLFFGDAKDTPERSAP